ncbi:MAG: hypothetical protein K2M01_06035 [Paramuribaculum sp.]|nr:hypothetical protein [Paramuribaculum sp.]
MNDKISLRRLAAGLTGFDDIDEDQKVVIAKEIFAEIANILAEGEDVKITGFGTFSVTTSNVGEKEVTFTPTSEAAAIVNAPFAAFMPDELCDAVSDQMLDKIDNLDNPAPEETVVEPEVIEQLPTADEPITEIPVVVEPAAEIPVVVEPVEETLPEPIEEEYIPEPQPVVVPGEVAEVIPPVVSIPETPDNVTPVVEIEPHPVVVPTNPVEEEIIVPQPISEPEPEPVTEPAPEAAPAQPAETSSPVKSVVSSELEEPDDRHYRRHRVRQHSDRHKSRFGLGFLCGILSGLAIGGMAFLAYILYEINTAPKPGYDDYDEDIYTTELTDELTDEL